MAWYRCVGGAGGSLKLRTATGRIATFNTNMVEAFKSLKSDINPVQDLHGYSKPWSGGCGKNKLNATTTIAYMTLVDGVYTITSLPQNGASWSIGQADLKAGTYILNGGVNANYRCYVQVGGEYYTSSGADVSFTLTSDTLLSVIGVLMPSATVGQKMKPMIRKTGESADFEPYSNICPISGFSALNVTLADGDMQTVESKTVNFGQTVYGGVADVTNGKVNVTHKIVDLGSLTWDKWTYNNSFYAPITQAKNGQSNEICSNYKTVASGSQGGLTNGSCCFNANNVLYIKDVRYEQSSREEFKSAMNGVMLVYELATPIEITTTPENLTAISGENNVYGDTNGDTEVKYLYRE